MIAFVPGWTSLDVFHCGFLIVSNGDMRLRHAARSRGGVFEEPLPAFLNRYRPLGTIVARPIRPAPHAGPAPPRS